MEDKKRYRCSQYNILIDRDENFSIIYNCYSGGIVKLENKILDYIVDKDFYIDDIRYGQDLMNEGYIVNTEIDEFQRISLQIENTIRSYNQESVSYVIAPTLNCNLNCVYCFEKNSRKQGEKSIVTIDTLNSIKEYIVKSNENSKLLKKIKITWFGGEPLLCFDEIVFFCKELKKDLTQLNIALETSIITNGVLLDKEKLLILKDECNLTRVQITLDGLKDTYCKKKQTTPEVYNKVIQNVVLSTQIIKTVVRLNADKNNYLELHELVQNFYKQNVNKNNLNIHFAQLRDYDNLSLGDTLYLSDDEYWDYKNLLHRSLEKNSTQNFLPMFTPKPYCGLANGNNMVIDFCGNLYKCEHYIGQADKIVGNIYEGVFYNDSYLKSIKLYTDKRCETCNVFPCCNYAQCAAMHCFSGNDYECHCYSSQLKTIINKVKNYLENKSNGYFKKC